MYRVQKAKLTGVITDRYQVGMMCMQLPNNYGVAFSRSVSYSCGRRYQPPLYMMAELQYIEVSDTAARLFLRVDLIFSSSWIDPGRQARLRQCYPIPRRNLYQESRATATSRGLDSPVSRLTSLARPWMSLLSPTMQTVLTPPYLVTPSTRSTVPAVMPLPASITAQSRPPCPSTTHITSRDWPRSDSPSRVLSGRGIRQDRVVIREGLMMEDKATSPSATSTSTIRQRWVLGLAQQLRQDRVILPGLTNIFDYLIDVAGFSNHIRVRLTVTICTHKPAFQQGCPLAGPPTRKQASCQPNWLQFVKFGGSASDVLKSLSYISQIPGNNFLKQGPQMNESADSADQNGNDGWLFIRSIILQNLITECRFKSFKHKFDQIDFEEKREKFQYTSSFFLSPEQIFYLIKLQGTAIDLLYLTHMD